MTTTTYDDHEERIRNVEISVATIQAVIPTLATKEDLERLRGEFTTGMEALRADMYRMEARLIRWMVGAVVASNVAIGSIVFAISRYLG